MDSQLSSKEFEIDLAKNFHIAENITLGNYSISKHNPTVPVKVFFAIMFVMFETVGNFMLYCMIIYEKYGMDCQKRTVTNQLLSSICGSRILYNCIAIPIVTIQQIFGYPLSKNIDNNSF